MKIRDLFDLFIGHYSDLFTNKRLRAKYNPPKTMVVTKYATNGIPLSYLMMMPALLLDGTVVAKTIYVEDAANRTRGRIELYHVGWATSNLDAVAITHMRSALMAGLAIHYAGLADYPLKIGFIGNGPMNIAAVHLLSKLFNIATVVLRGSSKQRDKNYVSFAEHCADVIVDDSHNGHRLSRCDVVISCTSNADPAQALPYEALSVVPLVIVQDGNAGGIHFTSLPEWIYVDHPEQSLDHWEDEFGIGNVPQLLDLTGLSSHEGPALVSLYGAAYFDGLLANFKISEGGIL